MHKYILEREQELPRSRSEAFAFFADATNLELITPGFLRFRILSRAPIMMKSGRLLKYRLALLGIRFNWLTLIESWRPESSFVDIQLKGPYSLWRHTHEFEPLGPDRTLVRDRVEYSLPFGFVGRIAHALLVKRLLKKIFDYRAEMTTRLLASDARSNPTIPERHELRAQRKAS